MQNNLLKEAEGISGKIKIFDKMFDTLRYVDPIRKKIIKTDCDDFEEEICFDMWCKNKMCDNCVSLRAHKDNQTYVKIEYSLQNIYILTAIPIDLENGRLVVELIKDVTKSMLFEESEKQKNIEVHSLINKLNTAALKDGLTDVYNRRFVNERLPVDILNSKMADKELSLILCDLDHFKAVNDNYGHIVGDSVLKRFAAILEDHIKRSDDWVARFGGEEFMVCLPNTSIENAAQVAEQIRVDLMETLFDYAEQTFNVTASFGVCSLKTFANANAEEIIDCADKKLYEAKRNGRNRVVY